MNHEEWTELLKSLTFNDPERPWRMCTAEKERFAYWDDPIDQEATCDFCLEPGADRIYIPAGHKQSRYFVHRSCLDAHMREDYADFLEKRELKHVENLMRLLSQAVKNYPDRKYEIERQFGNFFFGKKK